MKIGLCASLADASTAHEAGFDYIEENVQNLLVAEQPDEIFAPKLKVPKSAPLPVLSRQYVFLPCVRSNVPDRTLTPSRLDRYASAAFQSCA